ncbi:MAG TPA: sugar phosphate isomerase/epimerase [Bryobacteraceae bacterium]|nr:sugar phosphate isomerase/epimerase [Bryobacteraceae bacterium]
MKMETTRRGFLGATAGLAGLTAAGAIPAAARIVPEPWGIKLGIATYSFRNFDRAKAIEMIKALQAPWISVKEAHLKYDSTPEQLAQARKEFEAAGLKIMSGGNVSMPNDDPNDIRRYFEYAKNAGLPMMVCAPTHTNIKTVEKFVKEYNIRIAIHTHGPEDKQFPTPQTVLKVVHDLDPRCGLCMDVGHSIRAGADVVKSVSEAGDRLFDLHVKDLANLHERDSQCDVGDGLIPFPELFKALKKANFQGCVNLEYEIHPNDPLPGMQRSFSYMRGVLAGLAAA